MSKIILNDKFKKHMDAHNEFNKDYKKFLTEEIQEKVLKQCRNNFNIITIKLDEFVGKCNIVTTTEKDNIFWAKRINRDIYSRFVKDRFAQDTNLITFILKEQYHNKGFFNLISMFPSNGAIIKEIFDENLQSNKRKESIDFWSNHAFVGEYEEGTDKDIFEIGGHLINKEFNDSKNYKLCGGDYINYNKDNKVILMWSKYIDIFSLYYYAEVIGYNTNINTCDYTDVKCKYTGIKIRRTENNFNFQYSLI